MSTQMTRLRAAPAFKGSGPRTFHCEDCGWETPFRELFGLKLGCYQCGGALLRQEEFGATDSWHYLRHEASAQTFH